MLGFASALAVLDTLHEYLRQDAATIITRFMRLARTFGPRKHRHRYRNGRLHFLEFKISRGGGKTSNTVRRNKRRAEKNAKDKAASYLQSLFREKGAKKVQGAN